MKTFVRVLALLLVCLTCLPLIVACNGGDDDLGESVTVYLDENGVRWAEDEWGYLRQYDDLPFDLDYNDEKINILVWNTNQPEFIQTEETEEARASSIFKRNNAVQDRLGVELNMVTETAGNGDNDPYAQRVSNLKASGLHDFDLLCCYSRTAGTLLANGLWRNLSNIEGSYIDIKKPWWPANIVDNLSINEDLYYVSGDISMTAIDQMQVIFFNKYLLNEKYEQEAAAAGFENATAWIYNFVYEGKWTVDVFLDFIEGTYKDRDGSNTMNVSDIYGLSVNYRGIAGMYNGCNLRMVQNDPNKILKLSDDFTSTRTTKLVSKLGAMMNSGDAWGDAHAANSAGSCYQPFLNGNGYFLIQIMDTAQTNLASNSNLQAGYGILPYPKYDTNQANYYTMLGNPFSIYGIYNDFEDRGDDAATAKMLTAILECWASESYRKCTPVIFELNMQLKLSETQDETNMCEYVRVGIMFDMGRIFPQILSGGAASDGSAVPDVQFANACINNSSWTTYYQKTLNSMTNNLKKFVDNLMSKPEYQ